MKRIEASLIGHDIYILPESRTRDFLWFVHGPLVTVPVVAPIEEIGVAIRHQLSFSRMNQWGKCGSAHVKEYLRFFNKPSVMSLYREIIGMAEVSQEDQFVFTPFKRISPRQGYDELIEQSITVPLTCSDDILGEILLDTFKVSKQATYGITNPSCE